jgi:type IV pilus assembly protein PilY1
LDLNKISTIEAKIMKISTRKFTWMSISCAYALLAGVPVIADDTELLLVNPAETPTPNVMFIIDTSDSMNGTLSTIDPYNSTSDYSGDCDQGSFYWTDVELEPDCATTQNVINPNRFVCASAQRQIEGIGSFTNTMIQYRTSAGSSAALWQTLAPGNGDAFVECQADSGIHGDGTDPTRLWAASGSNLDNIFADNQSAELSWGSSPRNISYTVYTGNYLNWKNNPQTIELSKINIVKKVATQVLSSIDNMNVGIMRFNFGDGGPVVLGMTDLDQNRQDVIGAINDLPTDKWTPLSETMYEAALFWRGMPAYYGTGDIADTTRSDPTALASLDPAIYKQPEWNACSKNYNVLLTDGEPRQDQETTSLISNLPNFSDALGYAGCDGPTLPEGGQCLDDIAQYLSVEDIDPNTDGEQRVTTHTIGFDLEMDLPLLNETAEDSGGTYFMADDVGTLTATLLSIIANINDRSLSFSAPAVSVNTFNRTQNLNDLYITTFSAAARAHWPGNLKKYRIADRQIVDANDAPAVDTATGFFLDTATSYWTTGGPDGNDVKLGGAAQQLPAPLSRNLYTNYSGNNLTSPANDLTPSNTTLSPADFGLTGAEGEPELEELIRWARGEDVLDEDNNPATTVRKAMGDPLHSQPAAIIYGGDSQNPDVVVFTATNDGYLHAIAGDTGDELWSFIPKDLLSNLTRLYFNPAAKYKQYGIDGNVVPVVKDVDQDGTIEASDGDFVQLIFGMRRGGNTYYSLDVTDKNSPRLLWKVSLPEAGESWSSPVVARIDIDSVTQNPDNAVVVIGGGYNTVHDSSGHPVTADGPGAGVHMLDLKTGAELWRAGADNDADLSLANMTRAMPNEIRVIDFNGDGYADRMYASDLGGQVWRFDISNGKAPASLVTGGVIARLGAEGLSEPTPADVRRFYNAPDVSLITDNNQQRRFVAISIGSGYRAHPFDLSAADRFFSIRDNDVFNQLPQSAYDSYPVIVDDDLVEVSGQTQAVITSEDRGWKFTLPANQKILADSLTFDDQIFFVAFSPDSAAAATCSAGQGSNFLYRMSVLNGDPIVSNLEALSPEEADAERRTTLQQGGIAPTPAILFPSASEDCEGAACSPPPVGCVGVECFDPGFVNNPVRTLWTQDGIE